MNGYKKTGYIYNGILVVKRNEMLPFAITQMDLEGIMLSEESQIKTNMCGI